MKLTVPAQFSRWLALGLALGYASQTLANPSGLRVKSGSATVQSTGPQLTVTTGGLTVLNWGSFNIRNGETTTFVQPSANSVVFNLIGGASPSKIFGGLNANGTVILANSHGFYFGPNSFVNVGGNFIATTTPLPPDLGAAASWEFTGTPPLASIINYGQISTGQGHSLYLIAEDVENHGNLSAPAGNVGLYAGQEVLVTEQADGRGLSATVKLPAGSVDNTGHITADAGTIALNAQVVNQNGVIQADSVVNQNGTIELVASGQLNLGAGSQILARGDDSSSGSPGGSVTLKAGDTFADSVGSQIITTGGAQGGNGGNVEVSAESILSLNSSMDASAQPSFTGGQLLLDPTTITLGMTGSGSVGSGSDGSVTVGSVSPPTSLALNVNTAFANKDFSSITLEATGNIMLSASTVWNLSASTGETSGTLTLEAGGNIVFANASEIEDSHGWSVNLDAGMNFATQTVTPGTGSIYLSGGATTSLSGTVQTSAGNITMTAGEDILVGKGNISTVGGGSITLDAISGSINAGTGNNGYTFTPYSVSSSPGGIATAAGGNVALTAGNEIISSPTVPSGSAPGASGAYGPEPGNVTLVAGNEILGNYVVANGTGIILAGVGNQAPAIGQAPQIQNAAANVGSATSAVELNLISGTWEVWAANNIYIQEVLNPNGSFGFNKAGVPAGEFSGDVGNPTVPTSSAYLFNYAPNAAADFWAGNGITLTGTVPQAAAPNQGPIYPPILSLNAGAGGISLENSIILFPSSEGSLQITTRNGGDVTGEYKGSAYGIIMSDSGGGVPAGTPIWTDFATGQASTPLHLNDPNPVVVDVSGDINSFSLTVPTFAQIAVGGNTSDFNFTGQNLSPSQTTSINVGGSITYLSDVTSVPLATPLPASLFTTLPPTLISDEGSDPALATLEDVTENLQYNASTGELSFHGVMTAAEEAFLLSPYQVELNSSHKPVLGATGQPVTETITLNAAQQAALTAAVPALFADSQTATLGQTGLQLAGPGHFQVTANSINLGASDGIQVLRGNSALTGISPDGASLTVNTFDSLSMTYSQIADEALLGGIQLNVGATLDVGAANNPFSIQNSPTGIFTSSGGAISITAVGDVDVDGSRITTYDGGNINIRSTTGNVDAGTGGTGLVDVEGEYLNSKTGQLVSFNDEIPGSGIMAVALPHSPAPLGNITINTPKGSIDASRGGILQIPLNGESSANNYISLDAGQNIDASGSGVIGANLQLNAGGAIDGILVSTGTINANAASSIHVTAFAEGDVAFASGSTVSGTIISAGTASVSGQSITAALISESASTSGSTTGAAIGVPQSNVPKQDASTVAQDAGTTMLQGDNSDGTDDKKKKDKSITLAQRTGRVTVILPGRKKIPSL